MNMIFKASMFMCRIIRYVRQLSVHFRMHQIQMIEWHQKSDWRIEAVGLPNKYIKSVHWLIRLACFSCFCGCSTNPKESDEYIALLQNPIVLERGKYIANPYSLDEKNCIILVGTSEEEGIDVLQAAMNTTPKERMNSYLQETLVKVQDALRNGKVASIMGQGDKWIVVLARSNKKKDYDVLYISKTKPYKAVSTGIMRINETVNHIALEMGL